MFSQRNLILIVISFVMNINKKSISLKETHALLNY
jgi:hypothetical protein